MPQAKTADQLTLEYETYGQRSDPPLLMISGLGSQLISWPREFCERLADRGRFVIAFDNRDCGLSSKFDDRSVDVEALQAAVGRGDFAGARAMVPYTLSQMADDAVAVLDAVEVARAHVLGVSLGGMIAQTLAIEHPDRLLSLISVMSTTGEVDYGQSTPEAEAALLAPSPADRAGNIAAAEKSLVWHSRRYPEVERLRQKAAESYDRSYYPQGTTRQLAAILASGSRADGLRALAVPTLVIHGLDDTLIDVSGGQRTAELVPGAKLLLVEDMGHDRPEPLWPTLCEAIIDHTAYFSDRPSVFRRNSEKLA